MAEMRTLEIPVDVYEQLAQRAEESHLSLQDFLKSVAQPALNPVEKLKAEGKNPMLAFVGVASDPDDPNLSEEVREVMEAYFRKKIEQDDKDAY